MLVVLSNCLRKTEPSLSQVLLISSFVRDYPEWMDGSPDLSSHLTTEVTCQIKAIRVLEVLDSLDLIPK
jgi:hypothetical protein